MKTYDALISRSPKVLDIATELVREGNREQNVDGSHQSAYRRRKLLGGFELLGPGDTVPILLTPNHGRDAPMYVPGMFEFEEIELEDFSAEQLAGEKACGGMLRQPEKLVGELSAAALYYRREAEMEGGRG